MRNGIEHLAIAGLVALMGAGLIGPGRAASERFDRFAPPSWPEETVYRADCSALLGSMRPDWCNLVARHER